MSRKHFEALAAALRESKPLAEQSALLQWQLDVAKVSDVLAESNPRFDRGKFLDACGR